MSAYGSLPTGRRLPGTLRATRILLFVGGIIGVLSTLGYLVAFGADAETLGRLTWSVWPSVAALILAFRLPGGGRKHFIWIVVVGAVWVLMGLAALGRGEPRGLTSIIIPIAILVLVTRPASRRYLS